MCYKYDICTDFTSNEITWSPKSWHLLQGNVLDSAFLFLTSKVVFDFQIVFLVSILLITLNGVQVNCIVSFDWLFYYSLDQHISELFEPIVFTDFEKVTYHFYHHLLLTDWELFLPCFRKWSDVYRRCRSGCRQSNRSVPCSSAQRCGRNGNDEWL